jgi:hypothetical protein
MQDYEPEIDLRKIGQIIASSVALGLAIYLLTWVLDYLNTSFSIAILSNVSVFLKGALYVFIVFVLLIGLWDYLFPKFEEKLKYIKPLVDATSLMFGLWLVAIFFKGLTVLIVDSASQIVVILTLLQKLYFEQFAVLYILFILIAYSKMLFMDKK